MTIFLLHVKYFIIDVPKDILFIFNLKKSYCACYLLVYFFFSYFHFNHFLHFRFFFNLLVILHLSISFFAIALIKFVNQLLNK